MSVPVPRTAIPPATIEWRYLDGSVVPRGDGLTLRHDYPDLEPASGPMFPTLFALAVVPFLLLVALLLRGYRAGIPESVSYTHLTLPTTEELGNSRWEA